MLQRIILVGGGEEDRGERRLGSDRDIAQVLGLGRCEADYPFGSRRVDGEEALIGTVPLQLPGGRSDDGPLLVLGHIRQDGGRRLVGEMDEAASGRQRCRRYRPGEGLGIALLLRIFGEGEFALFEFGFRNVAGGDDVAFLHIAAVKHPGQQGILAHLGRRVGDPNTIGRIPDHRSHGRRHSQGIALGITRRRLRADLELFLIKSVPAEKPHAVCCHERGGLGPVTVGINFGPLTQAKRFPLDLLQPGRKKT